MMKRRFFSGRFRFPLFWRYFTLLAVVVAIFIFALYTSIHNSSGIMQSAYSDHVQDAFEQHCDLLSENMEQINSLIISMDSINLPILIWSIRCLLSHSVYRNLGRNHTYQRFSEENKPAVERK